VSLAGTLHHIDTNYVNVNLRCYVPREGEGKGEASAFIPYGHCPPLTVDVEHPIRCRPRSLADPSSFLEILYICALITIG
jgi:hypothetical protein